MGAHRPGNGSGRVDARRDSQSPFAPASSAFDAGSGFGPRADDAAPDVGASAQPLTEKRVLPRELAALRRAFELSARGPADDPNPRVGCVLLAPDGGVIAEGWHRGAGTAHAEAAALAAARAVGSDVRGATAVVSLEPCAHWGLSLIHI